jgi:hypothetical protein
MRVAAFGLIGVAVLVVVLQGIGDAPSARAELPQKAADQPVLPARLPMAAAGDLMAFSAESREGPDQVTLIDAKAMVMGVYHIDRATGMIELKCVRKFRWDLQMEEFNGQRPLPRQIRDLVEPR